MERDCESELSKLNIEQNACIYHFGASVIHGQRSNILRLLKGNLIYNIEQNKFSSRKIVLQSEMPKNKKNLEQIINSKLFDLQIEKETSDQPCFIEGMDFITNLNDLNFITELKKYIKRCAQEEINEKNK